MLEWTITSSVTIGITAALGLVEIARANAYTHDAALGREKRRAARGSALALLCIVFLLGCNDDESGMRPGDGTGPEVRVIPEEATVTVGESFDFDALVRGTQSEAVTWAVVGTGVRGSIDADGVYTAPDAVPSPPTVLVEATVQAALDASALAQVTVVP